MIHEIDTAKRTRQGLLFALAAVLGLAMAAASAAGVIGRAGTAFSRGSLTLIWGVAAAFSAAIASRYLLPGRNGSLDAVRGLLTLPELQQLLEQEHFVPVDLSSYGADTAALSEVYASERWVAVCDTAKLPPDDVYIPKKLVAELTLSQSNSKLSQRARVALTSKTGASVTLTNVPLTQAQLAELKRGLEKAAGLAFGGRPDKETAGALGAGGRYRRDKAAFIRDYCS